MEQAKGFIVEGYEKLGCKLVKALSIGSSSSGFGMECYPPHPSSIPISDMLSS
jgi:hypothetical protein